MCSLDKVPKLNRLNLKQTKKKRKTSDLLKLNCTSKVNNYRDKMKLSLPVAFVSPFNRMSFWGFGLKQGVIFHHDVLHP